MISLRKSLTDLDQLEGMFHAASEAYREALQAVRDNVVEVDARAAAEHKDRLSSIVRLFDQVTDRDAFLETATVLRTELRGYQETTSRHLGRLHHQLSATVSALQQMMESLASGSENQQDRLKSEMERLKALMRIEDLATLRSGISESLNGISGCIDHIHRQNQLVVAQLRDEIRTLHSRVESAERTAAVDPVTGTMNRREVEVSIQREVSSSTSFCLIFVWVKNLKLLQRQYGRKISDDLTIAACRRFTEVVEQRGSVGRWSDDELIAIVRVQKTEAIRLCKDLPSQLKGPHECTHQGRTLHLLLQVSAGVVEARPGERAERLLDRADTLMRALAGN
ncbi:MAG: diguanylate cyclase [Acidobacteria bacterium]|nr:diguanylate cyclase [Acidobacteriota bacterium]